MNNSTTIETLVAAANNTLIVATSIMNAVDSLTKTYSTSREPDIYEMYMSSDNNTAYVKRVRDMFERLKPTENRIVKKRMVRKKIEIHNESRM